MIDERRAARDRGPFAAWQHRSSFRWNNVSRPGTRPRGAPDGIVVLGGAVTADVAAARNDVALNEAAERMTATVELARRYPNARIIFSGGDGSLVYGGNELDGALRLFERLGLPPGRVELEDSPATPSKTSCSASG